jgi:hypothetical protein
MVLYFVYLGKATHESHVGENTQFPDIRNGLQGQGWQRRCSSTITLELIKLFKIRNPRSTQGIPRFSSIRV